ncbi:MAG: site-2 protease family protein [bacterium]|nr:site-2 protease family protein [bacterium]
MTMTGHDKETTTVLALLADLFDIGAVYRKADELEIALSPRYNREKSIKFIKDRLKLAGYKFHLEKNSETLILTIDPKANQRIPVLNILLFFLTLLSVYFVPVFLRNLNSDDMSEVFDNTIEALGHGAGVEFVIALISILFVHEMGHFIASRRRNIVTSWPYFIPAPNIIGTFGAIIKSKSPFWNRRDLIEVGAAGPIAGWIVALLWLAYGLSQSGYFPANEFDPAELAFSLQGESLIMRFLTLNLIGAAPEGYLYRLTEAAFAGWVGMLVTAINMLPIGQLDGGHVTYGLWREKQHILGMVAMALLLMLGFQSQIWWVFAAFGVLFGIKHPPTLQDNPRPQRAAAWMGWIAILILLLSFTPVPFR